MGALTAYAISHARVTMLALFIIIITGISTFLTLPSREDPEIIIRNAVVSAAYPGMSPDRIEQLIAKPIEEAIKTLPEVDIIKTVVQNGKVIIKPQIADRYTDLPPIWQKLRNKMQDIKTQLPQGTQGPFVNDDFGKVAAATLMLWGDDFSANELHNSAKKIRDQLAQLSTVASVDLYGVQEQRIWLEMDQDLLAQFELSPQQLIALLQSQNVVSPGGSFNIREQSFALEPSGNFDSISDLQLLPIKLPGYDGNVYLQDIVNIKRGYAEPIQTPVLYQGKSAISLGVATVANIIIADFDKQLRGNVRQIKSQLPLGMQLDYATYQPTLINKAVSDASNNLYQTIAIVLAVVVIFLGLRSGLIVGAIVPLTMLVTLIAMAALKIELHRTSLAAIIISLGLLVDNGIVITEEIKRRLQQGQSRLNAAIDTANGLSLPLLTSSLTTILAFMPLMLAQNSSGEYLRSLAQVVILALFISWFLAVVIVPFLCYFGLRETTVSATDPQTGKFQGIYNELLNIVLNHRLVFIVSMLALLFVSAWGFNFVPKQFMSASDRPQFLVYLDLPAGTHINETLRVSTKLANYINEQEEIKSSIAYVNSGGPRFFLALSPPDSAPYRSYFVVNTHDKDQVLNMMRRIDNYILTHLPQARGRTDQLFLGPSSIGTVEYRISGPSTGELKHLSMQVQNAFRKVGDLTSLYDDWDNPVIKFRIEINQEQARRAGVSSEDVATMLSTMLDGQQVTDFREGDTVIPIMLRGSSSTQTRIDQLATINIISKESGAAIPLLQVAQIKAEVELAQFQRRNQSRTITVFAKHQSYKTAELYNAAKTELEKIDLGNNYEVSLGGELESSDSANSALFEYMPVCLLLIVVLLVWQFNSFRRPFIIMATIPLILIGAVLGLLVTQVNFSFTGMLGLFSLAGIIVNNGIVLIDKIDQQRDLGDDINNAICNAAMSRLRPIVMTTLTTILGLLPLIFFGGDFWIAMGIVIAFGLAVGTVLTLLFVPALYSLLFNHRWSS